MTSLSVGLGLASALDTLCSQAHGAKRYEKIGIYFQTGVIVLTVTLIPMLFVNAFTEPILKWLGQDAEVASYAGEFSRWMLPGVPCLFLYELTRKVLQAQNIMTPLVTIAAIGNVVNVAAGYGLAYHTSIGFNGIAIGRSLGNFVLPLLLVPYFMWRPHHLKQWWCHPWDFKAAIRYVRLFLRLGVPGMLMLANIRVGNCLGANMPKKAKMVRNVALVITLIVTLFFAGLTLGLSDYIPLLFLDKGKSADLAARVMALMSPQKIVDGLNAVTQGVFRGAGKQKSAAIANAVAYYLFGVPFGALLAFQCDLGVEGLWIGMTAGNVLAVCVMAVLMRFYWNWDRLADDAQTRTNL
ncbi:Multidrug and toxin extrusion protein 1 [Phytophthora nicotianae]|uniref:Multidrug and toxin extrusion protein 1 n=1 Tax=Phytophthora nicotianae TaxID=4792 RepID=A0A0W8CEF2_PHYNI|nr:Multidrug and toxin extrusion protein 1 [Phytophthora nicotianae]